MSGLSFCVWFPFHVIVIIAIACLPALPFLTIEILIRLGGDVYKEVTQITEGMDLFMWEN